MYTNGILLRLGFVAATSVTLSWRSIGVISSISARLTARLSRRWRIALASIRVVEEDRMVHAGCVYDQQHRMATDTETKTQKKSTGRDVTVLMATTLAFFFMFKNW